MSTTTNLKRAKRLLLSHGGTLAVAASLALLLDPAAAIAQTGPTAGEQAASRVTAPDSDASSVQDTPGTTDDEILVTARRRDERSIDVPVAVTAFSGAQLDAAGSNSLADIGRRTPQFQLENNVGAFAGIATLRGVTSPSNNVAADSATTLNVDGVPLSNGPAVRLGILDIGQVEVLKGPQALFFGKNASAGIVSIRGSEPTHKFETLLRAEYETDAREWATTAIISGPLTDTLLARVAIKYSDQRGKFINDLPTAKYRFGPGTKDLLMRGAINFEPNDRLTIKLKALYEDMSDHGNFFQTERIACPTGGIPAGVFTAPGYTDCQADNHMVRSDGLPNSAALKSNPMYRDGVPFTQIRQALGSLDINYGLSDSVALNSVTGYYQVHQAILENFIRTPIGGNFRAYDDKRHKVTQEIRLLSTDTTSPFSWMIGGYFEDDHLRNAEDNYTITPPTLVYSSRPLTIFTIDSKTYSAFAQASIKFLRNVTLSGGARYTSEAKKQQVNLSGKFIPNISFSDISPEFTLSYKPTENLNLFASYREGYKSGSFAVNSSAFVAPTANPAITLVDNSYRAENAKGFEAGVKAVVLDRQLRFDLIGYHYRYSDLQLNSFDPVQVINRISNAAAATVQGVEFNTTFQPRQLPQLRLNGAIAYNRARYVQFVSACYVGQTIAAGCTIDGPDAGTVPDRQDLSGRPLPRAPEWSGNVGFSWDQNIGSALKFSLNSQGMFQSSNFLAVESTPLGVRKPTFLIDAGISLGSQSGSWELSLIGKNLRNTYFPVIGYQEQGTGSAATTGTTTGLLADITATLNRGREIWLRLTLRPNMF